MSYEDFLAEWRNENSFIICNTSGSTGKPKTIELPKDLMRQSAGRTVDYFGLKSDSHLHSCISPDYIGGKMMAVRSEELGCELTWETPTNRPLRFYRGNSIDLLAVVPSQMIYLLENLNSLPEIKHIIIGGAPIPHKLRTRIAFSGLDAYETYGMTETASHIAVRKVTERETPFMPLHGIEVSVDTEGRLGISMDGYPDFVTNDIAEIYKTDHGNGFYISGRYDNVINTGGKKVYPEKIEYILEKEFGCPVLITSAPDERWGERVVMVIEDGNDSEIDFELTSRCKSLLDPSFVPKQIIHSEIPLTPNGKKERLEKRFI